MDRMSAMDAMFYYMEGENTPMHVGGVAVLEGPAPAYGDLVRLLAGKMDQVPRYRQVIKTVPFQLGRPIWVDDPHFQILYHVRHTSLPQPGGPEQLRNLAGRVFAQRLDMTKPVWEAWLVEGLADDRWALISKAHHCMIDGEGSTDLMQVIFDLEPDPVAARALALVARLGAVDARGRRRVDARRRPGAAAGLGVAEPDDLSKVPDGAGRGRRRGERACPATDRAADPRSWPADSQEHERPARPQPALGLDAGDHGRGQDDPDRPRRHGQRRHPRRRHPGLPRPRRGPGRAGPRHGGAVPGAGLHAAGSPAADRSTTRSPASSSTCRWPRTTPRGD